MKTPNYCLNCKKEIDIRATRCCKCRAKYNNNRTGTKHTEETKRKIGKKSRNRKPTNTTKAKISSSLKKYFKTHDHTCKGKTVEEIFGEKKGKRLREKNRDRAIKQLKKGIVGKKGTLPERLTEQYLICNNIEYEKQWSYKLGVADFYLPETNTVLEVDGDYWHSLPEVIKRDKRQTKYLTKKKYNVIRLKEKSVKKNDFSRLIKTLF